MFLFYEKSMKANMLSLTPDCSSHWFFSACPPDLCKVSLWREVPWVILNLWFSSFGITSFSCLKLVTVLFSCTKNYKCFCSQMNVYFNWFQIDNKLYLFSILQNIFLTGSIFNPKRSLTHMLHIS